MAKNQKSDEEVKRDVTRILEEIEALKEQAREQGRAFSSLDEEQLAKKVRGETSNSPFVYAQSWTSAALRGSTVYYTVHVSNPDPVAHFPFYVTVFFGLGNLSSIEQAWIGRDKRWPDVSSERAYLAAGANSSFTFHYTVPTGLPLGTYNGNSVLWKGHWHDVGTSFDRGSFDLKLL